MHHHHHHHQQQQHRQHRSLSQSIIIIITLLLFTSLGATTSSSQPQHTCSEGRMKTRTTASPSISSSGGRAIRLLLDLPDEGIKRIMANVSSVEDIEDVIRKELHQEGGEEGGEGRVGGGGGKGGGGGGEEKRHLPPLKLEMYDTVETSFQPLPSDLDHLPSSTLRIRVAKVTSTCISSNRSSCNGIVAASSSGKEEGAPLALPWRRFPLESERDACVVAGRPLVVRGIENSGQGTGHTTWDGGIVLAKYLEWTYGGEGGLKGKRVLETGAGTGFVGLTAGLLGASEVKLTDLPYTLENLQANVDANNKTLEEAGVKKVVVLALDWYHPPSNEEVGPIDLILAADVVWLNELVEPLAFCLSTILPSNAEVLMSYQSRSKSTDQLLHSSLNAVGLEVETIPPHLHHPDFKAPDVISILRITRREGERKHSRTENDT